MAITSVATAPRARAAALRASLQRPAPTIAATDHRARPCRPGTAPRTGSKSPGYYRTERDQKFTAALTNHPVTPGPTIAAHRPALDTANCPPAAAMQGHAGHDAKGQHT